MINPDFLPPDDLQISNGKFSINSGAQDPSAFFNIQNNNQQLFFETNSSCHDNNVNQDFFNTDMNGFGVGSFFGLQRQEQIVTPNAPFAQASSQTGPQCSGNCGACIWSFLCKNPLKGSPSFGVPRLG